MAQLTVKFDENHEKTFETEVQPNTLTPVFQKTLKLSYSLSSRTQLFIQLWDVPGKKSSKVLLGSNTFSIHEVASRKDFIVKELWLGDKRNGNLHLSGRELKDFMKTVIMKWNFRPEEMLKDFYFLRLSRVEGSSPVAVFQTETCQVPIGWEKFEIGLGRLCKADSVKKIQAEVIELSSQVVFGSTSFSLNDLNHAKEFYLNKEGKKVGILELQKFETTGKGSFLDIVRSGIEICPFYTIDFSERFGHSLDDNVYLKSVEKLQQNLNCYSLDPLYTVLGTGALFEGVHKPCFCFALNGNIFQPEVVNHSNLTSYYSSTFASVLPSGVTKFAEVIELAVKFIQNEINDVQKYYVVFLISSGDPQDIDEIVDKYQVIKELPLSIFVVRVDNDLLVYENIEKLRLKTERPIFACFDSNDLKKVLNELENHVIRFAEFKNLFNLKAGERLKNRSNSLKLSPEKVRVRSNYFTKTKVEYIDYLIKIGYSSEKIEEISQIGVPYLLMNIDSNDQLPSRVRTKTGKFNFNPVIFNEIAK
jgi:hypothetical protein